MATINELTAMQTPTNEDNVPVQTGNANFKTALHNNRSYRSGTTFGANDNIKTVIGTLIEQYIARYGKAAGGFIITASWSNVANGIALEGHVCEPYSGIVEFTGVAYSRSATYGCVLFRKLYLADGTAGPFLTSKIGDAMTE